MIKGIILLLVGLTSLNCIGFTRVQDSCNTIKAPLVNYIDIINMFYCGNNDTGDSMEYNPYCDTSGYDIYLLSKKDSSELILVKAKMPITGGKEGDDFTIFEINNNVVEPLNVFTGYLDCIKMTSTIYPDIIFYCPIDCGRIKIQISRIGKYYHRKKVLDIEGNNINKKNRKALLKNYNSDNESGEIQQLEGFKYNRN